MKRTILALAALLGIVTTSCYCGPMYSRPGYGYYGGGYRGHYGPRRW